MVDWAPVPSNARNTEESIVTARLGLVLRWRHLLLHLVRRDLQHRWRRSALGPLWMLVNPLILLAVYGFVFSVVLRVHVPSYPLFLLAGLLPWLWFAAGISAAAGSIPRDASLLRKAPFPAELLPLRAILVAAADCTVGLLLLILAVAATRGLGPGVLLVPCLMALQGMLMMGIALPLAVWGAASRDAEHLAAAALRVLFFATPVAWAASAVPARYHVVVGANPLAALVDLYRSVLLGTPALDGASLAIFGVGAAVTLVVGWALASRRVERVTEVI